MLEALLLGLSLGVASSLHCVAMCGPLTAFVALDERGGTEPSRVVRYQLGRTAGYASLGALAGAVGGGLAALVSPWVESALSIALALALLVAALQLWPRDAKRVSLVQVGDRPRAPTLVERATRASAALLARTRRHPMALGLASALLPCGVLASGVLLAASTGTFVGGAVAMTGLAVASGVGIGIAGVALGRTRIVGTPALARVMAVTLALGAVVMLVRPAWAGGGEAETCCHPH